MATVTVTGTITDPSGTGLTSAAFVRFKLRNFDGFVPRVNGVALLDEIQVDAVPDGSGNISQALQPNNAISPATTFYTVELWSQGRVVSSGNYLINGAANLNTAAQLNTPAVPPGFKLVLQNTGANNSSQSLLNLESTDGSIVITDVGAGTLNLQSGGRLSPDFMFGPGNFTLTGVNPVSEQTLASTSLRVNCAKFAVPYNCNFSKMDFVGASNIGPGSDIVVGVYDSTGATLIWTSGALHIPNGGAQNFTIALSSHLILTPGNYYMAWTAHDTGNATVWGWDATSFTLTSGSTDENIVNQNVVHFGWGSNAATSGPTLPSSLGTLTAVVLGGNAGLPAFFFQK